MRTINRGFTIIELLVVVAVIGILATITLIGFNRYQADGRDTQRSSQAAIISEALERYYNANGEYPGCTALTSTASNVTTNTLTGVETKTLVTPQYNAAGDNAIKCQDLTTGGSDVFAFVGDGSSSCSTGSACLSYTLKYKEEGTGTIKSINSRHTTSLLTSGDISNLSATTYSFSRIDLSWSAIGGATGYTIQWKLGSSDFTTPTGSSTSTGASASVTGLTLNTQYYFRVRPTAGSQTGNWSNTANATTFSLDTPTGTAVPNPGNEGTQIRYTWNTVSNATSYTIQYSSSSAVNGTTGDFTTSPTTITNATSPYTLTGLSAGNTRHFHVKSVASGLSSGWSGTSSATTTLPSPTGVTVAWTNDTGGSSQSATCSIGSPQFSRATTYRTDGSTAANWGAWSDYTTDTTFTDNFITGEGMYGKVKVKAKCVGSGGNGESAEVESNVISNIRAITSITAGTWYNQTTASARVGVGGACAGGTQSMYKWGEIYHGSAGYHSGGGWGQWGDFELVNSGWSMNDGLNVYRISRTICQTNYHERSITSYVRGNTLQGSALTNYNNFVNNSCYPCAYNYSNDRITP